MVAEGAREASEGGVVAEGAREASEGGVVAEGAREASEGGVVAEGAREASEGGVVGHTLPGAPRGPHHTTGPHLEQPQRATRSHLYCQTRQVRATDQPQLTTAC